MQKSLEDYLVQTTGAKAIKSKELVQSLWSGYGEILRYHLEGAEVPSVIVKHVQPPTQQTHPRGWNTDLSHERKLKSYQVECHWYQHQALLVHPKARLPQLYYLSQENEAVLMIMEDLDAAGYSLRFTPADVTLDQAKAVLSWLAAFHAGNIGASPDGLWEIGTYWHLDTRPMEWEQMQHLQLKAGAKAIDQTLNEASFQTLVHGDAKLANFCFSEEDEVAAVDFQYVGRGCGMKDVAYFISSCFTEATCEHYEPTLLEHYFKALNECLPNGIDFELLKREWEELYAVAWADFYRFLDGWSPGHWKMHRYSERLTKKVLDQLKA